MIGSTSTFTYDSRRGRVVVLQSDGRIMEWDGVEWFDRGLGGPHSYAPLFQFDSRRCVCVYLGSSSSVGNCWEWDGEHWAQIDVATPDIRESCGSTYDPIRGRVVMFGGYYRWAPQNQAYTIYGDTWEYDGQRWFRRALTGRSPGPRMSAGMMFDESTHRVVLTGGYGDYSSSGWGTWEWDGNEWAEVFNVTNAGIYSSAYYDPSERECLSIASSATGVYDGIRRYSPSGWDLVPLEHPANLGTTLRSFVYARGLGGLVSLGGYRIVPGSGSNYSSSTNELHLFTHGEWSVLEGMRPVPQIGSAGAADPVSGRIIMNGGSAALGETWAWSNHTWTKLDVPGPSARYQHQMVYDTARQVMVMFGGRALGATTSLDETWEWDGVGWVQRHLPVSPPGRYRFAMAYDTRRARTVVFGGFYGGTRALGDLWEYDGTAWIRNRSASLTPRYRHALAYDESRGVTVMFGGTNDDTNILGDTLEYDGRAWVTRTFVTSPPGRTGHQMVVDTDRHVIRMFGGWSGVAADDLWEYNGNAWTRLDLGGLTRSYAFAAYSPSEHEDLVFGGSRPTSFSGSDRTYGDTLILGSECDPPAVAVQQPARVRAGRDVSLTVSATLSGPGELRYQWRRGTPRIVVPGATSATYTIRGVTFGDAGEYDCIVTAGLACSPKSTISDPAEVSVLCRADADGDGAVDVFDLELFLSQFEAGSVEADIDNDGFIDGFDVEAFLVSYAEDC